jgi:hypothetical protein
MPRCRYQLTEIIPQSYPVDAPPLSSSKHIGWLSGSGVTIACSLGFLLPILLAAGVAWAAFFPISGLLPGLGMLGEAVGFAMPIAAPLLGLIAALLLIVATACWVAVGGMVFSLVALNWRPAVAASIVVGGMAVGFVPGIVTFHLLKHAGYTLLGWRSAPLIEAIKAYERSNGAPPGTLDDLTPQYLKSVPGTGMAAYPEYEYAPEQGPCLDGNRWHVKVDAGEVLQWDFFFYCPEQIYSVQGWGGYNEVIGDWAYLHE